jgi:hypothetical protein
VFCKAEPVSKIYLSIMFFHSMLHALCFSLGTNFLLDIVSPFSL